MPTFCNIDMAQTMAYWCLQKLVAYYGNKILLENLSAFLSYFETQSDHFVDYLFVFLSIYSLE